MLEDDGVFGRTRSSQRLIFEGMKGVNPAEGSNSHPKSVLVRLRESCTDLKGLLQYRVSSV